MNKLLKDKKLLIFASCLILATFIVPYITIPGTFIWWFIRTSRLSKKIKLISLSIFGGIFVLLVGWVTVLYAKDVQPHLSVTHPSQTTFSTKTSQITISGTFSPDDRTVEINGNSITTKNGTFNSVFQLKSGENKITVQAGKWKWEYVYLDITREVPQQKKATPIAEPKPTTKPTSVATVTVKPTVTSLSTPTPIPTLSASEKVQVVAIITANTNHFKQLWRDGQEALGTTQYDAYSGLDALNDPNSNASKFSQYKQTENPANDNSMNDALTQADKFYPSNVSDDALNTWRLDMIQLSSDMGLWANDATSWQIQDVTTAKLDSDSQTVEKDFATVEQDIQAIQ